MVPKHGDSQKKIIRDGSNYRDGCPEEILKNTKKRKN
jgi:hypothetical protein